MAQQHCFKIGHHLTKRCLVFGCGNPLFGDDGFGEQTIAHLLAHYTLPADVAVLDAGTAVRDLLFDILLSDQKPEQILIVDAMTVAGGIPGQIYTNAVDQIHPAKICDFSLHQFPTTNMLKEIQEGTAIGIHILVVHPEVLPAEVRPGLSPAVAAAVPRMCEQIMALIQTGSPPNCGATA